MSLPNQLTLLRILLTPFVVWLLFLDTAAAQIGAFTVFILASLTDWYDGYTARKYGYVSTWGKFFDPLADKILVTSVLVAFCVQGYFPVWMVVVIVVRDTFITTLRSYAIFKGRCINTSYLAKIKTFVQMGVIYVTFIYHLLEFFQPGGIAGGVREQLNTWSLVPVAMGTVAVLTIISGCAYIHVNRDYIRELISEVLRIFQTSDS
ncbi:CDP-diacylglycerol--glycerol-3-phosphate 3-phosphatidyltransferase [bacterium]|nr:CDP-diacylglycerol--glycerol-3-phosphate 3-phosphatidyltransferase [bacterium]